MTAPTIKLKKTSGFRQPRLGDSTKPVTTPPRPAVARILPANRCAPRSCCGSPESAKVKSPRPTAIGRLRKNIPPPGGVFNQPASKYWPNRSSDRRKTRPCLDRLPATFLVEIRTDDCQAAGHQQCGSNTLNASCNNQFLNARCKTAAADATAKIETPVTNMLRRPNKSPNEPPTKISAAKNSPKTRPPTADPPR